MLTADDDVAQAVLAKWNADTQLGQLVPGGLQRGRLSSTQPNTAAAAPAASRTAAAPATPRGSPYASLTIGMGRESIHHSDGDYIDFRRVQIEIRGLWEQVSAALSRVRDGKVFNRQKLATQAIFMACIHEDDTLALDPTTKQGEDIAIGTVTLEVVTQRPE